LERKTAPIALLQELYVAFWVRTFDLSGNLETPLGVLSTPMRRGSRSCSSRLALPVDLQEGIGDETDERWPHDASGFE